MKFAVISDIHGNIIALRAALAEIGRAGADRLLVLGDLFGSGHVEDVLGALSGREALIIRGNGEGYQLENDGALWERYDQFAELAAIRRAFTPAHMRWIAALPSHISLAYPGVSLRMVHGSPRADNESLLAGDDAALQCALDMTDETILLCGHSHRARLKQFGKRYICNAGSVGDNFDPNFTADVTFITMGGGEIAFDQRRVPYDFEAWRRLAGDLPYARLSLRGAQLGRGLSGESLWVEFLTEAARRGGWPCPNDVWNGLFAEWEEQGIV
ncbi:MAG: metallophosphatase family protein [Oscillospiraceae bacterium]|jgi:predicted phosphodiesterase|nr:metallophosphatase family protein [Oscillospiraceae bacterium]